MNGYSKTGKGYHRFHLPWAGKEGMLAAIGVFAASYVLLYIVYRILPPFERKAEGRAPGEAESTETGAAETAAAASTVGAHVRVGSGRDRESGADCPATFQATPFRSCSNLERRSTGKQGGVELFARPERGPCTPLAYGHTNAEIAQKMSISERTLETHRTHLMGKLDLKSRAELVRFAIDNGLLKLG